VLRIQRDLTSRAERERTLAKMVKVSAEGLADLEASIELYSELFKKNPKSDQAFGALEQALEKAGRWEDLRALAGRFPGRRAPGAGAPERAGVVLYRQLGRAEEASPLAHRTGRDARPEGAGDASRHRRAARAAGGAGRGAAAAHPLRSPEGQGPASGWPRCWAMSRRER
jgi:hypothetical protein